MKQIKTSTRAMRKQRGAGRATGVKSRYARKRRRPGGMMYGPGCCAHAYKAKKPAPKESQPVDILVAPDGSYEVLS